MASLALGIAGTALGSSIGGSILGGLSMATVGGMVGSAVGSVVDSMIVAAMQPDQRIEGQRLENLTVTTSTDGAVIPQVFGRMKVGGNIIWATDFREEVTETTQGGGKGGGPSVTTVNYRYYASFALALCEGPVTGIGRIWADGELMDLAATTKRVYLGDEEQEPDPFIEAKMGVGNAPAYRGTAYIMFEEVLLEPYGNRLPQFEVEILNPLAAEDEMEGLARSITMIPGTGEFAYGISKITRDEGDGATGSENVHAEPSRSDFGVALDRLIAAAPDLESVTLVISWFGNDLRCNVCDLKPGVEVSDKTVTGGPAWSVNGLGRGAAHLVSRDADDRPVYGGTPDDHTVVEAIREIRRFGLKVNFYPFILMDIPADNTLPDPYTDGGAVLGQDAFPWRGRITLSVAPGRVGTPDKTIGAFAQVGAFFGYAQASDFTAVPQDGWTKWTWTGGSDWGFRRMILHYAGLIAENELEVDSFLIGSEMVGLTTIRQATSTYPAVAAMKTLASDVKALLGAGVDVSYAADWSEYFGHQPADGSGDVHFHLDPLWSDSNIDFVGIDNYMPLSDWRDGFDHLDAATASSIYDPAYLAGNVEGGEGFDWYYASESDRASQTRSPITDGAGKPWVFRYKDMRSWWSNQHYNRPGGTEGGSSTAWVPESKPIRFTELGCPAVDRGSNQPNVFYDPKSAESAVPHFSRGWRDDAIQRAYIETMLSYWGDASNNPASSQYAGRMIDVDGAGLWTWDARPYPHFPALTDVWSDGANWELGHWLSGRLGSVSLRALIRHLCLAAGMSESRIDVSGLYGAVEGYTITALQSARASIAVCASHFGFDATESQGVIRFVMRGSAPVTTLTEDDLIAGSDGAPFSLERGQETELPQALKWTVQRADEEFDAYAVEDRRRTATSARVVAESFPLAVAPSEAFRRVRRSLMERWVGRETATFSLPPSRLALDPTDVLIMRHDGRDYPLRVQAVRDNDARDLELVMQDRLAYDLPPPAVAPAKLTRTAIYGAPSLAWMDLPQLTAAQEPHEPMLAAYAKPWPGEMAVYRSPEESSFAYLTSFTGRAQFAVTAAEFKSGPTSRWDDANELLIDVRSGTMTSVTEIQLLGGANAFAVETGANRWEIVQAAEIELVAAGRYRLSRLLRGQRGTEDAMVSSLASGARVITLDAQVARLPINESEVGLPLNWRVGPSSLAVGNDAYLAEEFTPAGRGLRPFAPCHVRQPYKTARVPGDLLIEWVRRSRTLAADNWEAAEVPMAEETEAYEIDIMDGSTVLRTLTSATSSVTYTGADQVTDFGAALQPGDTLDVRIAQMSTVYGRGAVHSVTLIF